MQTEASLRRILIAAVVLISACSGPAASSVAVVSSATVVSPPFARGKDPVITAAGDIAQEEPGEAQEATAKLVEAIDPTAALTLGDNQYPDGTLDQFQASYDPTWGRFDDVTRPVPGNHDYHTQGADGYFDYFGKRAHRSQGGYYSFDVGAWHLVAVNSGPGTISDQQLTWIKKDLQSNDATCELAYWHHPRWSSGTEHGSDGDMDALWRLLYDAGVDVVLNGHEHNYERFAPLDPSGERDVEKGIREFVVGTGGAGTYPFGDPITGSQKRITDVHGVLEMTLRPRGYGWAFVGTDGSILDDGKDRCHA